MYFNEESGMVLMESVCNLVHMDEHKYKSTFAYKEILRFIYYCCKANFKFNMKIKNWIKQNMNKSNEHLT